MGYSTTSSARYDACFCAVLVLALLVVFSAGSAGAADTRERSCDRAGATLVKETRYAQVLRLRDRLYGCLKSRGKLMSFGEVDSFGYGEGLQGPISMNGRWIAFGLRSISRDGDDYSFRVLDLKERARTDVLPVSQSFVAPRSQTDAGFTSVSVTSRGTTAWVIKSYGDGEATYEVWTADTSARSSMLRPRLVGQGRDIDPNHLTITEARVGWSQAGQQRAVPRG